jgi:hypothetical protein
MNETPRNFVQDPLPFLDTSVYNQNVPAPAEDCDPEDLHAALELLVCLVDWLAREHPDIVSEFEHAFGFERTEE